MMPSVTNYVADPTQPLWHADQLTLTPNQNPSINCHCAKAVSPPQSNELFSEAAQTRLAENLCIFAGALAASKMAYRYWKRSSKKTD